MLAMEINFPIMVNSGTSELQTLQDLVELSVVGRCPLY